MQIVPVEAALVPIFLPAESCDRTKVRITKYRKTGTSCPHTSTGTDREATIELRTDAQRGAHKLNYVIIEILRNYSNRKSSPEIPCRPKAQAST